MYFQKKDIFKDDVTGLVIQLKKRLGNGFWVCTGGGESFKIHANSIRKYYKQIPVIKKYH